MSTGLRLIFRAIVVGNDFVEALTFNVCMDLFSLCSRYVAGAVACCYWLSCTDLLYVLWVVCLKLRLDLGGNLMHTHPPSCKKLIGSCPYTFSSCPRAVFVTFFRGDRQSYQVELTNVQAFVSLCVFLFLILYD